MKPTAEQLETIEGILGSASKYRETYEELYDHILSALEAVPENALFNDALDDIMHNELGGPRGIKSVEAKYMKIAIKEFIIDYFNCWGQCLTSFLMLLIIPVTLLYYLLMRQEWFSDIIGQSIPLFISLVPGLILLGMKYIAQKKTEWKILKIDYAKSIVKPFCSIFMLSFPMFLWQFTQLICFYLQHAKIITRSIGYYGMPVNIATLLFFIIVIHSVAYYKLYKVWAKTIVAS